MASVGPPFSLEKVLAKAASFPQRENWNLTLEEIAGFDIEPGGSDIYYYYFQSLFNMIPAVKLIEDPLQQEAWGEFCYKPDCSTGLDPKKINKSTMRSLVRHLSLFPALNLFSSEGKEEEESVVLLQGLQAPKGMGLVAL